MKHDHFSEKTPWHIRKQILDYHATQTMSDAERAEYFGLPAQCRMRENAKIISPERLVLGENVWIGEGAVLDASGGLEIGANCQIGLGVYIWSHDSHRASIKGINTQENQGSILRKPTKIGDNCFIAGPSVIMPGVTIGNKCIISPMSVVYEDLPDKTVYKPYKIMLELSESIKNKDSEIQELRNEIAEIKKIIGMYPGNKGI